MAGEWLVLLAGSTLVIIGFLTAQLFERYRVPDYFVLMALGLVVGTGAIPIVGPDARASLDAVAPVLTNIAFAFILFEGGLLLRFPATVGSALAVAGHTIAAMAISGLGMWFLGTRLLGLSDPAAVVIATAFIGPSAMIILSVLPTLRVTEGTRAILTFEGVLGNILAVAVVLAFVRFPGTTPDTTGWVRYGGEVATSTMMGILAGLGWHRAVGRVRPRTFSFMTTVALALLLFAVGDGVLGGTGGVAAFAFGLVLGRKGTLAAGASITVALGSPGRRGLPEFHRELVFVLRTFFFLYLGLRIQLTPGAALSLVGATAFVGVFLLSRLPSTAVLARAWVLPPLDVRVLRAMIARGMTDTVLILYAIDVGVVEPAKASLVTQLLFLVVLVAASVSAFLVTLAERGALPSGARRKGRVVAIERPSVVAPLEPVTDPIDEPPPR